MSRRKAKRTRTRTLSVRLPIAAADGVETRAAAQHIGTSAYIADALNGRTRQSYPALAALGQILGLAHALKREPGNEATLQKLEQMIATLRGAVRDEVQP